MLLKLINKDIIDMPSKLDWIDCDVEFQIASGEENFIFIEINNSRREAVCAGLNKKDVLCLIDYLNSCIKHY